MQHITEVKDLKLQNTAIALGKFDGFHRGHQLLLEQVKTWQDQGMTGVIFTFAPAGRQIGVGKHIDSHAEKIQNLSIQGYRYYWNIHFQKSLQDCSRKSS